MMLSADARWFWRGAPPAPFEAWFLGRSAFETAATGGDTRCDRYLRAPNQVDLGIKQRGSEGVEIKGLIARGQASVQFNNLNATAEISGKWSADTLDLSGMPLLPVSKQRWLRTFRPVCDEMREVSGAETGAAECQAELTKLTAPDESVWWTFGFEAHGALAEVERILERAVAGVPARTPPQVPTASPANYPAWLSSQTW
jgi:hypothetical protein